MALMYAFCPFPPLHDTYYSQGNGNPIGGLIFGNVFGNKQQFHEWTEFISDTEFCIRACIGPNAAVNCNHIYDLMGVSNDFYTFWWKVHRSDPFPAVQLEHARQL
jgi:hypothetical protein